MQLLGLLVCVAMVVVMLPDQSIATPSPIVIIPGIMGSRLEVEDNKPHSLCSTRHKYKKLWIDPIRMVIFNACAKRELPLLYDSTTNSFHNNTNVKIHVPGFGNTNGVEYLTTGLLDLLPYFHDFVEYFVDRGYKRGGNLRAAPYDWRLAADELEKRGYFHQLKSMIEDMYNSNGRTKVTLVVHSMGGLVSLHFLTGFGGIDQAWKDKYIHAYVTLSAAWSGGAAAVQAAISSLPTIPDFLSFAKGLISNFLVPLARTLESLPWLFPKSSVFGNDVIVSTPSKDYTPNDYKDLFSKIGYTNGYRFFQGVQGIVANYPAPNVPTYCYYGVDVPTPRKFTYSKDFRPGVSTIGLTPKITYGNGDNTVNIESSKVCHSWSSMKHHFTYKTFSKIGHVKMVKDSQVLDKIASIVRAQHKKKSFWEKLFG